MAEAIADPRWKSRAPGVVGLLGGKRRLPRVRTAPPRPPWAIRRLRPLLRTPERRLRRVEARRGPSSPPPLSPTLRSLPRAALQVCAITVMCGACEDANGIYLDRTAQNARFDLDSAEYVYAQLQAATSSYHLLLPPPLTTSSYHLL